MWMPKGIVDLDLLPGTFCKRCLSKRREVLMIKLRFDPDLVNEDMAEALDEENNTAGVFCIFKGCDDNYESLVVNTKNLNYNKT